MRTNKTKSIILSIILLSTGCMAQSAPLSNEDIAELEKNIATFKRRPNIRISDGVDEGKYYFLKLAIKQKGKSKILNAFVDKKTQAVFIGQRYDRAGNKSAFPKTEKAIESIKKGISFTYGTGKKELYVVTDPQCPYCIQFEKEAQGKLGSDYTVHTILYPLSFHKKAPAMVEWIMQGKDDAERKQRMEQIMINRSEEYTKYSIKKGEKFKYSNQTQLSINNAIKAVKALGATGTPSVYTGEEFRKIGWKSLVNSNTIKLPKKKSK